MPYKIRKRGGKYEVINKETGESKGKSDTLKKALGHVKALFSSEPKRKTRRLFKGH